MLTSIVQVTPNVWCAVVEDEDGESPSFTPPVRAKWSADMIMAARVLIACGPPREMLIHHPADYETSAGA